MKILNHLINLFKNKFFLGAKNSDRIYRDEDSSRNNITSSKLSSELERTRGVLKELNSKYKKLEEIKLQEVEVYYAELNSELKQAKISLKDANDRIKLLEKNNTSSLEAEVSKLQHELNELKADLEILNKENRELKRARKNEATQAAVKIDELENINRSVERRVAYRDKKILAFSALVEKLNAEIYRSSEKIKQQRSYIKSLSAEIVSFQHISNNKNEDKLTTGTAVFAELINEKINQDDKIKQISDYGSIDDDSRDLSKNADEDAESKLNFDDNSVHSSLTSSDVKYFFENQNDNPEVNLKSVGGLDAFVENEYLDRDYDFNDVDELIENKDEEIPVGRNYSLNNLNVYLLEEQAYVDDLGPSKSEKIEYRKISIRAEKGSEFASLISVEMNFDIDVEIYLSDFFRSYWWASAKNKVIELLRSNISIEQLKIIRKLREMWSANSIFSDYCEVDQVIEPRKIPLPWGVATSLVLAYAGIPTIDELEQYLLDAHDIWVDKESIRREYPSFLIFLKGMINNASNDSLLPVSMMIPGNNFESEK